MIDGVININKDKGITSFKVVAELRKILGIKKTGHTGTLDPDVTGVLPVCIGKATKLVDLLMDSHKVYNAEMQLGIMTDTQDISGEIIESSDPDNVRKQISSLGADRTEILNELKNIFEEFTGEIKQIPPMYSALKVDGVKLVDAARKGITIERKERVRTVFGFRDIDISDDLCRISFIVECSKGTYVRTLCEDIGKRLKVPACLYSLVRTEASGLRIEDSLTIDEVRMYAVNNKIEDIIIPVDHFLLQYERITLNDGGYKKVKAGNFISQNEVDEDLSCSLTRENIYRVYNTDNKFLALYKLYENGILKPEKMFI